VPDSSFVVVAVIAFLAPVTRELIPGLFVPAIVIELLAGILVGPQVLGIAHSSASVELFSTIGLAALLFLAGREIQVERLRGALLERALGSFALSFLIAAGVGAALYEVGLVKTALLVGIVLVASSLSVIIVPLRDEAEADTSFGQQVIASAAIAEFGAVILLSFFYSGKRAGPGTELVHLCAFALLAVFILFSVTQAGRSKRIRAAMSKLSEGSAQIQVRADLALVAVVVGLATELGLESILAAFTVGVIRSITGGQRERSEQRLDAVALGIFVPFFFIASGLDFHLGTLFDGIDDLIRVPAFVAALLLAHLTPALLYLRTMSSRQVLAAGLLQATSFSFIIVATKIGLSLHLMIPETATSLVAAGLISVIAFPAIAFRLLGERAEDEPDDMSIS
jgi:Kef-type K+ transport system membrane component KefB